MFIAVMMIRLFLSVILLRAALHKLQAPKKFQTEMAAYRLIPASLVPAASFLVSIAEVFSALTLLNAAWVFPAYAAALLFCVYGAAMAVNLRRGRADINCGCAGPLAAKKQISWALVLRNLALTSLALLCHLDTTPDHSALAVFIIFAGALVALLLYEAIEQGIANAQGYPRWTH